MSDSSTAAHSEILPDQEPTMSIDIKAAAGEQESSEDKVKRLEEELQVRTEERENYKNRLQAAEEELADLKNSAESQQAADAGDSEDIEKLRDNNNSLREALTKAAELIKDKTSLCLSQERQNAALTNQIGSLKEVIRITKDLLNIRNMEVKHLQADVDNMEGKIKMERERQSAMISKMDQAVKLNSELKAEYENQLKLFQELKARYEERVVELLDKENKVQKENVLKTGLTNGTQEEENLIKKNQECKPEAAPLEKQERKGLTRVDSAASDLDEFLDAHEEIVGN